MVGKKFLQDAGDFGAHHHRHLGLHRARPVDFTLNLHLLDHDHRNRWNIPNQPVTQQDQDDRSHGHPDGFLAPRKLHCFTPA